LFILFFAWISGGNHFILFDDINLSKKFGDSKIVIRQKARELVLKLIDLLSPSPIFNIIFGRECFQKECKQVGTVREEILLIVIRTLLVETPNQTLDYEFIINFLLGTALKDGREKVRFVAVEALSVLNKKIPSKLDVILKKWDDEETYNALSGRFQLGKLPYLNEDGWVHFRPTTHIEQEPSKPTLIRTSASFSSKDLPLEGTFKPIGDHLGDEDRSFQLSYTPSIGNSNRRKASGEQIHLLRTDSSKILFFLFPITHKKQLASH
jgi:hypothetical protein